MPKAHFLANYQSVAGQAQLGFMTESIMLKTNAAVLTMAFMTESSMLKKNAAVIIMAFIKASFPITS